MTDVNIGAMRRAYPGYIDVLLAANPGMYNVDAFRDAPTCRSVDGRWIHGPDDPMKDAMATAAGVVEPGDRLYILLRPGFAYLQFALIETLAERGRGSRFLLVEDRLPLVRAAMEHVDWSSILVSDSTVLLLGALVPTLERFFAMNPAAAALPMIVVADGRAFEEDDPLLAQVGAILSRAGDSAAARTKASMAVTATVRAARSDHRPHVLIAAPELEYLNECLQEGFFNAGCRAELRARDRRSAFLLHGDWTRYLEDGADLIFWTNRNGLNAAGYEAARALGVKNVIWAFDNPKRFPLRRDELATCDLFLSFDPTYLDFATSQGAPRTGQMSTAAGLRPSADCCPDAAHWPPRSGPALGFVGALQSPEAGAIRAAVQRHNPDLLPLLDAIAATDEDADVALAAALGKPCSGAIRMYVDDVRSTGWRTGVLSPLVDLGLEVFGNKDCADPAISGRLATCYGGAALPYGAELAAFYYHTLVNVNPFHPQCIDATNSRVYDVLAAGGFLLTEDRPRIHEEFEVGRHLVTFRTPEECRAKAEHYLAHPEEREKIAREGQKHVLEHHTYVHRARAVLDLLDIRPAS